MAAFILLLYTTSSAGKVGHNRSRSQLVRGGEVTHTYMHMHMYMDMYIRM